MIQNDMARYDARDKCPQSMSVVANVVKTFGEPRHRPKLLTRFATSRLSWHAIWTFVVRVRYARRIFWGAVVLFASLACNQQVHAQAGLRESLERLDTNDNGRIEAEEVTPLARPYLERISGRSRSRSRSRIRFDESTSIDRIQEIARSYYAASNGVSDRGVRARGERTVLPFGPDPDEPLVPEFGLGKIKYPYIQDDLDEADRTLGRYDRNDDGYIDSEEAARNRWTHRNPFDDDLNKDARLSRLELTQRYARRRLLDGVSDELVQRDRRTGGEVRVKSREQREKEALRRRDDSYWLTTTMLNRFDRNRSGRLEPHEASRLGIPIEPADADGDGELTRDELYELVLEMQDDVEGLIEGLPEWFEELDTDRDGQIAMREFTTEWSPSKQEEFARLDINDDGLLTSTEVMRSSAVTGGTYQHDEAEVLPPGKTIISEIEVSDDYRIRDLDVQISITHTHTGYLDAYLTGPDGERVELFTDVGGGGDHFDQTVFDDQSGTPITKARPPFQGAFRPEAVDQKKPGLSAFNGKNVKGVWQLVVRGTRNDRFGMLHSWGLTVKPEEELPVAEQEPAAELKVGEKQ